MKNKLLLFLTVIAFTACEIPTAKVEKSTANVDTVNGLYVYIKAQPAKGYKPYDKSVNRDAAQDIVDSGKKKGFWKVLGGLAEGVAKNVSFDEQVNAMTELTKEVYPNADGVIFTNSLNECIAFEFQN